MVIVAPVLPGPVGTDGHLWHLFPVNLRTPDNRTMVRSRFGHYYPICLDNKLETQRIQMGWSGEMRILYPLYDVMWDAWQGAWHVTLASDARHGGCGKCDNNIAQSSLLDRQFLNPPAPSPALSHAANVKMSISLHFKWELYSDGRADAVASLIFYWNPTLQLWIASLVWHSKLSEPWHENTLRDWDPAQ